MTRIAFNIPGKPVGKGRPRFSRKSGVAFTPKETRNHEAYVKMLATEAMKVGGEPTDLLMPPFATPVRLVVQVMCQIPQSWNKAKREAAKANIIRPGKPDLDNTVKMLADAMNGVVFTDDALIYRVEATKMFADIAVTTVEVYA